MKYNDNQKSVYSGKKLTITVFGASHSNEIGVKIKGLKGKIFSESFVQDFLARRQAKNSLYSTTRIESDKVVYKSGFKNGKVTSNNFIAVIYNQNQKSKDYSNLYKIPRPSHADFVGYSKYKDGFDYRGGGKFSGRLTAPICIAGGIAKDLLEKKGIKINAFVSSIGQINGKTYNDIDLQNLENLDSNFPVIDQKDKENMLSLIESVKKQGDSVGGKIDCIITGIPVGLGEYMFDSLEGVISRLAFSVPAVKGIEFGTGFKLSESFGSIANDEFYFEKGVVKTKTNNNGGINGGISNGMPITFRVAVKPTPSILKEQNSVNLQTGENVKIKIEGRHDACIVPRAVAVIEAIASIAILDLI